MKTSVMSMSYPRQRGVTLIELMISLVISLMVLAGASIVLVNANKSNRLQEGLLGLQENARFAFDRINQDLSASGYTGCNDSASTDVSGNLLVTNTLTNTGDARYDFANAIDGSDNGGVNGSDTLSIRRAVTAR